MFLVFSGFLLGCEPEPLPQFEVTLAFPEDGAQAFPETPVRIGFNEPIDHASCDAAIGLASLAPDGRVVEVVPFELGDGDSDGYDLLHGGLVAGLDHALTVQAGPGGCLSADGDVLVPFASVFSVIERPN